jgi:hypothetical protein
MTSARDMYLPAFCDETECLCAEIDCVKPAMEKTIRRDFHLE